METTKKDDAFLHKCDIKTIRRQLDEIKKKVDEIASGWKNYFMRNPEIKTLAKERLAVCVDCEYFNSLNICILCYCPGSGKARSPESRCKMNKWKDGWGKEPKDKESPFERDEKPQRLQVFMDHQRGGEITEEEILMVVQAAKDSNFTFNSQEEFERFRYLNSLLP